LKDYWKY